MAELIDNMKSPAGKASMPTNEELIESLTSDIRDCEVKDETETHDNSDKVTTNKVSGEDITSSEQTLPTKSCENESSVDDKDSSLPSPEDDLIDELALKDLELTYSDEDKVRLHKEAEDLKQKGNELFKSREYRESALIYTQALRLCPLAYEKDRAIFFSNRAAAKMKIGLNESAIEDCTKSLELDDRYLKALFRRAQLYEATEKLDEALADYTKILELDPLHRDALQASKRLPYEIQERNEKLKTEMLGKLKELGNMVLKPFGLSTDNFQLNQDPNSSGYSVNFKS